MPLKSITGPSKSGHEIRRAVLENSTPSSQLSTTLRYLVAWRLCEACLDVEAASILLFEFNLWASDRELTTVLKIHKEKLDPDLIIDEPVKLLTRNRGIVDLMLSRSQKRHRANEYEHLVIELKAPKVKLTSKELTQIKDYALSVGPFGKNLPAITQQNQL